MVAPHAWRFERIARRDRGTHHLEAAAGCAAAPDPRAAAQGVLARGGLGGGGGWGAGARGQGM